MNEEENVRLNKWLWAARHYKTRQIAIKAIKTGKIKVNKRTVKPASMVKPTDEISIDKGLYSFIYQVLAVSDKRGPAKLAQTLYCETSDSISARKDLRLKLENQPRILIDRHKPDKRGVRTNRALKRGQ